MLYYLYIIVNILQLIQLKTFWLLTHFPIQRINPKYPIYPMQICIYFFCKKIAAVFINITMLPYLDVFILCWLLRERAKINRSGAAQQFQSSHQ